LKSGLGLVVQGGNEILKGRYEASSYLAEITVKKKRINSRILF